MKTEFDPTKRMQLLVGSTVICKKNIPAIDHGGYYYNSKTHISSPTTIGTLFDFQVGKKYSPPHANCLMGDTSGGHTFSIEYFREHFTEIPSTHAS